MKFGFASLVGRPNAGKSTLLNRVVGAKLAIISDKPQTTRTRILGVRNYEPADGDAALAGQVVFLDTPGIHRPRHRLNVRMVDIAVESMRHVDVLVLVADASEQAGAGDRFVLDMVRQTKAPVIAVLNKVDQLQKQKLLPLIDWYREQRDFAAIVPLSALTGENVDAFEREILHCLPHGEAMYPADYVTDQPERVFVAETVREKLLQHTHAELPFATAIVVDGIGEGESVEGQRPLLKVYCSILVDRESQKPIVIGRGGRSIKQIGTEARQELERFFQAHVFLDLLVKVKPSWRENEQILDELGIGHRER